MEEVDFLHEICLISLYASRAVKFAAVVDSKGKLILAKFKKFHIDSHRASLLSARKIQQQDQTLLPQSCHSFYYEHLTGIFTILSPSPHFLCIIYFLGQLK